MDNLDEAQRIHHGMSPGGGGYQRYGRGGGALLPWCVTGLHKGSRTRTKGIVPSSTKHAKKTRCRWYHGHCTTISESSGEGRGWHKASVSDCLPLAAPIGLSPLLILTLCGSERVLVVSTEPPDDLSCLTTPGVGRPRDGLLPVQLRGGGRIQGPGPAAPPPPPWRWGTSWAGGCGLWVGHRISVFGVFFGWGEAGMVWGRRAWGLLEWNPPQPAGRGEPRRSLCPRCLPVAFGEVLPGLGRLGTCRLACLDPCRWCRWAAGRRGPQWLCRVVRVRHPKAVAVVARRGRSGVVHVRPRRVRRVHGHVRRVLMDGRRFGLKRGRGQHRNSMQRGARGGTGTDSEGTTRWWASCSDASEGKGPQRRPQKRLGRRLEEVAEAVGGGYCRLQMPLKLALAVRGTVAGHRLGALEGLRGGSPPSNAPVASCAHTHAPLGRPTPGAFPSKAVSQTAGCGRPGATRITTFQSTQRRGAPWPTQCPIPSTGTNAHAPRGQWPCSTVRLGASPAGGPGRSAWALPSAPEKTTYRQGADRGGGEGALRVGASWEEGSGAGCSCQPWKEVLACFVA